MADILCVRAAFSQGVKSLKNGQFWERKAFPGAILGVF
jgi:hypothetical protein